MKPVPLVLIAGFLGAGKTTFLQDLLEALKRRGVPVSVMINDFENAAVDAARLLTTATAVVETISGACVCCSSLEEFLGKLATIEVPDKGVLLVEANGTSDYITLIAALTGRSEAKRFTSPLQVTMIDVSRWQKRSWHNQLEREQVQTSTHWRLCHVKKGLEQRVEKLRNHLAELAPRAVETDAEHFAQYLSLLRSPFPVTGESHVQTGAACVFSGILNTHEPHRDSHHVHHHDDELAFTSMAVTIPEVVEPGSLKRVLDSLPNSVLRVKGICKLTRYPGVAFSIQHLRPEVETWCQPIGQIDIEPTFIIIGVGLPVREIRSLFGMLPAGSP